MRLFVAVELPSDVCDAVVTLCTGLKDVRWVAPRNMHLTLAFLGELDSVQGADLHAALNTLRFDPFDLQLAGVDCFESRGKVRVLWTGVDGGRVALCHLQHKIMTALERAGLEPERRKFKPHVTLSYLNRFPKEKLLDYISENNRFKTESFKVSHFSLFQSHLTQHGAEYEVLERYGSIDKN